jgi:hypothetical protein
MELEQTSDLLLLPRVQGNARDVLQKLKLDLEKQIASLDRRQHPRPPQHK